MLARLLMLGLTSMSLGFAPAPVFAPPLTVEEEAILARAVRHLEKDGPIRMRLGVLFADGALTDELYEGFKQELRDLREDAGAEIALLRKRVGRGTARQ